jgi:hypothetical protein
VSGIILGVKVLKATLFVRETKYGNLLLQIEEV